MKAQLLTMSTPDGPFTILAQDGVVLASGWTAEPGELTGQIHPELRPADVEAVTDLGPISRAVEEFYAGDPAPAMAVPVLPEVGAVPVPRLGCAADGAPGGAGDIHRVRRIVRKSKGGPGRGQRLRLQRRSVVCAVPPRHPHRRLPGRFPLGPGSEGEPARAGGQGKPAGPRRRVALLRRRDPRRPGQQFRQVHAVRSG